MDGTEFRRDMSDRLSPTSDQAQPPHLPLDTDAQAVLAAAVADARREGREADVRAGPLDVGGPPLPNARVRYCPRMYAHPAFCARMSANTPDGITIVPGTKFA